MLWQKILKGLAFFVNWPLFSYLLLLVSAIIYWDNQAPFNFVLLSVVSGFLFFVFFKFKKMKIWVLLVLMVGFCLALFTFKNNPLSSNLTAKPALYKAQILDEPVQKEGTTQLKIILTERLEPLPAKVSGQIRLTIAGACAASPGSIIQFESGVREPSAYHNAGGFAYDRFLKRQNIHGSAFLEACDQMQVVQAAERGGLSLWRHEWIQNIRNTPLKNSDLILALLWGVDEIEATKNDRIRWAGLSHLFVISGLQFVLMAGMAFALAQKVLNFFPKLFLKYARQKLASAITLVFVVFYALMINHHPSVLRAALTLGFYLGAVMFEKQKNGLHILMLSMAVSLFFYPMELFHVGFQMSYLCVLTLVLMAEPLLNKMMSVRYLKNTKGFLAALIKVVFITWLLNLMLLPLVLAEFGKISLNGLIQNLWAIPYFEFLVTPMSFIYLLASVLSLTMAPYLLIFLDAILNLFWLLFGYFEFLSLPDLMPPPPHESHLWIFYVGVFLFFYLKNKKILKSTVLLLFLSLSYTLYQNHYAFDFRIIQLDVGQGDSLLVQSRNRNYLIDAGGHAYLDMGQKVVWPALNHHWVHTIDVLMITHGDADHYKGVEGLLSHLEIKEVWVGDFLTPDEGYQALLKAIQDKNISIKIKNQYEWLSMPDSVAIEVLAPIEALKGLENKNDQSLVVKISHLGWTGLFTGDISAEAEKILALQYGQKLKADFLKVSHHGSAGSGHPLFLSYVAPAYAGIGVKKNSPFGHPSKEILDKLAGLNVAVYRTDTMGQIEYKMNNGQLKVTTYF